MIIFIVTKKNKPLSYGGIVKVKETDKHLILYSEFLAPISFKLSEIKTYTKVI